jgi:hypothetical protein
MLQVTADVFSGRPNPSWLVTDEQEERAVLRDIAQDRSVISDGAPADAGLGFRGVIVESLSDDNELSRAGDAGTPSSIYIPVGAGGSRGADIAQRVISLISRAPKPVEAAADLALDQALQDFLQNQVVESTRSSVADGTGAAAVAEEEAAARAVCYYDTSPYNPGFWNNDPTTRARNNCYNYASNKRTNTFAQPGRGCGRMYTAITCAEMTRASLCDGLHRRFDCFPDSEYPRYLVALVVAPGPGFVDFHWYRKMREGYWGHKPGSTAVRNVDNSNVVIADPATCNRGPYTQFCGYFYTCKSQRIN